MEFSDRLKKLRKEKKIKQEDIAQYLNVSRASYGHYETGHTIPTKEIIEKLADYFNVSTDYLLCRTEVRSTDISDDNIYLLSLIEQLSHSSKKDLEKYIHLLKLKDTIENTDE